MQNRTTIRRGTLGAAAIGLSLSASAVSAAPVFHDDFESGSLSNWTGKSGGVHSAFITADPLDASNHAITFDTLAAGGDAFTVDFFEFEDARTYEVSFDYLGLPGIGSRAGNLGGFIGIAVGTPGTHQWFYGTTAASGSTDTLIDDGVWRRYSFLVDGDTALRGGSSGFRLMIEDWSGSGGVAGDAFFDNFVISPVPTPGAGLLAAGGLLMVSSSRRRIR